MAKQSKSTTHLRLRVEEKLLQRLERAAKQNGKTLTGEITTRLEKSFEATSVSDAVAKAAAEAVTDAATDAVVKAAAAAAAVAVEQRFSQMLNEYYEDQYADLMEYDERMEEDARRAAESGEGLRAGIEESEKGDK